MGTRDLVPRPQAQLPVPTAQVPPWAPEAPRESESALAWLRKRRHWTVPVLALPALWTAGTALHAAHLAGVTALTGLVVTALVSYFARHKWGRTGEQWYAALSAGLAALWLWAAAWLGPVRGMVTGCVLGGALLVGVAVWGGFWWAHKRPRGTRKRAALIAKWDAWWQSMCAGWGLAGSAVADVQAMGVQTRIRIHGIPGRHSIQHVNQVMHLIESGLDGYADIGMVRAAPVKGKPSAFDLFLKQENPLREIVPFDMATAPRSVHDPFILGRTETGGWQTTTARRNRFVIGETRSGKSNDLLVGLAQLTGCADSRQVLIDLKGGRSARPVLRTCAVDYVVTEVPEARMLLLMLVTETSFRAKYAYDGEEQLLATAQVPSLHTLIDETYGLTAPENGAGDAECRRLLALLASQGSAVEEYEWVYTQHGSLETSVGTEQIRANLRLRIVYRVTEARHGQFVIPEFHKLDASKLEEQGTCYVKDGPRSSPEQVRAPHMPHSLLEQVARANAALVAGRPPLRLYCGAEMSPAGVTWQEWWDTRWLRLDPAFRKDSPQYAEAAERYAPEPETDGGSVSVAPSPATVMAAAEPGTGDAAAAVARMARELHDVHAGAPDGPPRKVNLAAVMAAQKDTFAGLLQHAPEGGISPTQLQKDSGMSSSWTYQTLQSLADLGFITQLGRGRYVAVPGRDIAAGIAMIKESAGRLYQEAKVLVNAG